MGGFLGALRIRIFYSKYMDKLEFRERTWKERLFTLPWKPMQKVEIIHHPYMAIVNGDLYAHPLLKAQLERLGSKMVTALDKVNYTDY